MENMEIMAEHIS